jgi:AraC family transcriptional regulator
LLALSDSLARAGGFSVQPRIEVVPAMQLVGLGEEMSRADDATVRLWQTLMPRRHEIENRVATSYLSMRIYSKPGMAPEEMFAPDTRFEKWAAVQVADGGAVPVGMRSYSLGGGMYAVFLHQGPASGFPDTMRYIFGTWLPQSQYELDDREHFELIPEGWTPTDAQAQEELFVPIRKSSIEGS